jgi:hypothetical protein
MANSREVDLPLKHGIAHYIVSEVQDMYICREAVVMAQGNGKFPAGTILGRITAAGATLGQFKPWRPEATDGSQNAIAILFQDVDTTSKAVKRTITARHTEVQRSALSIVGAAVTDAQKNAAYAQLAVNTIIMR